MGGGRAPGGRPVAWCFLCRLRALGGAAVVHGRLYVDLLPVAPLGSGSFPLTLVAGC